MWWEADHSISPTRVKGVFQEFSLWTIGHLNREWGVAWILFLHFQYFALIRWPWRNLPYPFRALSLITFILHRHIFVRQWDKKKQTERMGSSFFPPISGRSVSKRGTWVDGQDLFHICQILVEIRVLQFWHQYSQYSERHQLFLPFVELIFYKPGLFTWSWDICWQNLHGCLNDCVPISGGEIRNKSMMILAGTTSRRQ